MSVKFRVTGMLILGLATMSLPGCGSSGAASNDAAAIQNGFAGKWRGVLSGGLLGNDLVIDVDLKPATAAGSRFLDGTMKTNAPFCFNNASASGEFTATSLNSLSAIGNGTAAQQTIISITGELAADKITGLFQMISDARDCDVETIAITLNRQP